MEGFGSDTGRGSDRKFTPRNRSGAGESGYSGSGSGSSASIDRLPPQNREAEAAVIGAMMMSQNALDAVEDVGLRAGDFYAPAHRTIFEAIHKLREAANEQVDELTVTAQLQQDDQLENVGGQTFVYSLTQRVPAVANTRSYAEEVVRQSTLRALVRTGETISALGYEHPDDPQALIDQAGTIVMDLTRQREQSGWEDPSSVLGDVFDELSARAENGGRLKGLTSGFVDYDQITGGLHPGTVSILAARPAMGKTAWALNVVENVALRAKKPVAVFSLEMDAGDLLTRMMCSVAKVDSKRIRIGVPHNDDWPLLVDAIGRISAASDNLYIDQSSTVTPLELRSKCRRLHQQLRHKGGLGLIVIDYLQLMEAGRRMDNRQVEIAFISRQLKTLARELKVPIIALSQLSRAVEARTDKRPILSDLRESGSIEQDADLVMFLHRPEYYEQDNPELRGLAELIIAKHRNGEVGTINLGFRAKYTQFVTLTKSPTGPGGVPSGAPGGMPAAAPSPGMSAPSGRPMPGPGFGAAPAGSGPPVGGFHDDGPV